MRFPKSPRLAASSTLLLVLVLFAGSVLSARPRPQEAASGGGTPQIETVLVPSPNSPLVALRLLFKVGSLHDPAGKEGLAALTALMLGKSGTASRTYPELVEALYPLAASIGVTTDREVTVFSAQIHRERLSEFTALLTETLVAPGFRPTDFERNRSQLESFLTATLRSGDDELLGLEAIQQRVFDGHPYGHSPAGTVQGLRNITVEDVKAFYRESFTQGNLMLGVAGGYPDSYVEELRGLLADLPPGPGQTVELPPAPTIDGRHFTLIEKQTDSVGIHIAFPLPLTRKDPDYFPLMVANSFLGEHRTFHGRLMQQLRGLRGLNYGDYSYIEHWHNPPGTSTPSPNVPRRQQYFSVWVRPVVPNTAHFALRNALYEVDRLIATGMTEEELELTRNFLINYSKLWAQSLSQRLGFVMDSRFYGGPDYIPEIERRLSELTLDEVNSAIRKYLQTENFHAVMVTAEAEKTEAFLKADEASPMTYGSQVPDEVLEADRVIQAIKVRPDSVRIVPAQEMFESGG